jgi:sensor domain CHASE-containing protein
MKKEETLNKINEYITWKLFTYIIGGLAAFATFIYGVRSNAIDSQFEEQDDKIKVIVESLEKHAEIQNANDLKIAESLGQIKEKLGIQK